MVDGTRVDGRASLEALHNFAKPENQTRKTGFFGTKQYLVLTEKKSLDGKSTIQSLACRQLSLLERIKAIFGFGNASISKIVHFCTENNIRGKGLDLAIGGFIGKRIAPVMTERLPSHATVEKAATLISRFREVLPAAIPLATMQSKETVPLDATLNTLCRKAILAKDYPAALKMVLSDIHTHTPSASTVQLLEEILPHLQPKDLTEKDISLLQHHLRNFLPNSENESEKNVILLLFKLLPWDAKHTESWSFYYVFNNNELTHAFVEAFAAKGPSPEHMTQYDIAAVMRALALLKSYTSDPSVLNILDKLFRVAPALSNEHLNTLRLLLDGAPPPAYLSISNILRARDESTDGDIQRPLEALPMRRVEVQDRAAELSRLLDETLALSLNGEELPEDADLMMDALLRELDARLLTQEQKIGLGNYLARLIHTSRQTPLSTMQLRNVIALYTMLPWNIAHTAEKNGIFENRLFQYNEVASAFTEAFLTKKPDVGPSEMAALIEAFRTLLKDPSATQLLVALTARLERNKIDIEPEDMAYLRKLVSEWPLNRALKANLEKLVH